MLHLQEIFSGCQVEDAAFMFCSIKLALEEIFYCMGSVMGQHRTPST